MPRTARAWEPGGVLHVDARAFEGCAVFAAEDDREFVLRTARRVFAETRTRCLAWAILSNHYHMLLQCDTTPPWTVMHRMNTRIAAHTRRLRGERGPVFQDRYFSRICTDDRGYVELLAYVLGNPLRHGVVKSVEELERHRWTGLGELLDATPPRLIDAASVLGHFDADPEMARTCLRAVIRNKAASWIVDAADPDELPLHTPVAGDLAIPSRVAVDEQLRRGCRGVVGIVDPVIGDWDSRSSRRILLEKEGFAPAAILAPICARLGADPAAVLAGRRSGPESSARAVLAWVACDYASFPAADLARLTGVASSSISEARSRGRRITERLRWSPEEILREAKTSGRP